MTLDLGTYSSRVLDLYSQLPDTPLLPRRADRQLVLQLHARSVDPDIIESALLLATARRLCRPSDRPPLPLFAHSPTIFPFSTSCFTIPSLTATPTTFAPKSFPRTHPNLTRSTPGRRVSRSLSAIRNLEKSEAERPIAISG